MAMMGFINYCNDLCSSLKRGVAQMNAFGKSATNFWRIVILCLITVHTQALERTSAIENQGQDLFKRHCYHCHNGSVPKAPHKYLLQEMPTRIIYQTLTTGAMKDIAANLADNQRRLIAEYLTQKKLGETIETHRPLKYCENNAQWFDYAQPVAASGWGIGSVDNTRSITQDVAGLTAQDVKRLKLKWAFAFPSGMASRSLPAAAGGALFIGSKSGRVFAMDAKTGCVHWVFKASSTIRAAISMSGWQGGQSRSSEQAPTVYFGGNTTTEVYAVNAVTGELRWRTKVGSHRDAKLTGSPTLHTSENGNYLYVPLSSTEVLRTPAPSYSCCTFRGSVSKLNADTGEILWKSYVIPTVPTEQYKNAAGTAQWGPSGAGVWNSPTIDEKRGRLYVGTGENGSSPTENGGAIVAINLSDGNIDWVMQTTPGEAYNMSCGLGRELNCPKEYKGRIDLDFAASPVLLTNDNGKNIIVAAQKTGWIFGLDPDRNGKILWRTSVSRGDYNKGVLYGMAADQGNVFATVRDDRGNPLAGPYPGIDELGVYAIDAFSGKWKWSAPVSRDCKNAQCRGYSAALTTIPNVVFAPAKDGFFRALNSVTGELLWQFNTAQHYNTVNGTAAQGGSINGPGPIIVNGMVYLTSGDGFASAIDQLGNVLLAFSVDGK
jgi:polyvinyl alcohol dehydrogenase (cytochrome)